MKVLVFAALLASAFSTYAQSPECLIDGREVGSPHEMMTQVSPLSVVGKRPGETLPWNYEPQALKPIPYEWMNPSFSAAMAEYDQVEYMRSDALNAMLHMMEEARREGIKLFAHSAYRPYQIQCAVFSKKVREEMKNQGLPLSQAITAVNTRSALPGQSEHQLGTVVDFVTDIPNVGYKLEYQMQDTPAFQWLKAHASKFGFVLSFPAAQHMDFRKPNPHTGYVYEPWHWRFINPHYSMRFAKCNKMTVQQFLKALAHNSRFECR